MIKISRTEIKNLASSDITYARGVQFYKNNSIINPTWSNSSKQYSMTVMDNYDHLVLIDALEDKSYDCKCNCSNSIKKEGYCKHIVAALLFVLRYQELSLLDKNTTPKEKKIDQIIEYFSFQEDSMLIGDTYTLELNINISQLFKNNNSRATLNLRAGHNKMYKIQAFKKFLNNLHNAENIFIGKDFKYVDGESRFDSHSTEILDYLLGIYEIQGIIEPTNNSKVFNRSEMILTKHMLIKLLKLLGNNTFNLNLYGSEYKNIVFKEGNPPIIYHLSLDNESVIVDFRENKAITAIVLSGELLFYDNVIYKPDKEFLKNFQPFYNNLGPNKEPFVFSGQYKTGFLEFVLPQISNSMKLDIPDGLKDRYITHDLESLIYFDILKKSIKAEVRFKYGEYEFNSFESPVTNTFIVVRQKESELKIIKNLLDKGFVAYQNYYILKKEEDIYDLISDGVKQLEEKAHLFYSKDFKSINIQAVGSAKTNISYNKNNNMLDLDFVIDNVPKQELKDLFYSFKIKNKYYRLKNGSFVNLADGKLEEITRILNNIGVSTKNISENISLNKNRAVYVDKVFAESDFEFSKDKNYQELIYNILNPIKADYNVPDGIQTELKPYQITGYKWLKTLVDNNLGGILADDMGLGKTLQAITLMASALDKSPYLIVCPSSLIYNWQDEIENFTPFIKSVVVNGNPTEREEILQKYMDYNVLITSYPLMRRDIKIYQEIVFDTVFVDEAQYIKNDSSQISKAVKLLNSKNRFALTGTPIENNLSELWSIFDFIMPDYLDSYSKFSELYEKPIMKDDPNALNDLNQRIAPFILRRMKKEVLTELPDKYERKIITDLTDEQKKVYQSYVNEIRNNIHAEIADKGIDKSRMKVLAALTRLRQICCHPSTFIENYEGGSGKLDLLMDIIPDAIENDHRILIFSQFTSMLEIIEKELLKRKISYFYLEGTTPTKLRNEYVKRFNNGENEIFLISLKAGGTGLNLTGADMVIHYDPWWNPAVEEQATDRAYRIGQLNKVEVIKMIAKGTIEEKIYKLQEQKKDLLNSVINTKEVFINALSKEELENLFW